MSLSDSLVAYLDHPRLGAPGCSLQGHVVYRVRERNLVHTLLKVVKTLCCLIGLRRYIVNCTYPDILMCNPSVQWRLSPYSSPARIAPSIRAGDEYGTSSRGCVPKSLPGPLLPLRHNCEPQCLSLRLWISSQSVSRRTLHVPLVTSCPAVIFSNILFCPTY